MTVQAVIFDWGGTLTPWHTIDHARLWSVVCEPHFPPDDAMRYAAALLTAESDLWQRSGTHGRSATMSQVFDLAGVPVTEAFLDSYLRAWEPHTFTDPDVPAVLGHLREHGIRVGVLSNTMWPRDWHDEVFRRDGVLDLIDGSVYSSEIAWTKPRPEAFRAAMTAVGANDPAACVFVGDRPYDDVHGAQSLGMRAVLVPHSDVPPYPDVVPDAVISRLSELPGLIASWR